MESDREGQSLEIFSNVDIAKNEESLEQYLKSNKDVPRSNQSQHVDYENLDIDLVKFLENSMSENKYQLFWISPSELRNQQKIFGTARLSAKYSAEWTYLHKTGARTKKFIDWGELIDVSKIDGGYFGFIFNAYWIKTQNFVICKALTNLKDINNKYYTAFVHELTMQTKADLCENVVRFLGVSKDDINSRYFLIMEYANDGNLRKYLETNNHSLTWSRRLELAFQITKRLNFMHSENIIHRDLHDKNIVIHDGKAKITDFGNAISLNTQTNMLELLDSAFGLNIVTPPINSFALSTTHGPGSREVM
ncbi:247_t:CDS:2 [Racocetra persica]|uniref:247_t:CDS:1 n=1 Tax=Racocetra persica TaxID=160502 RepID=A0ACA9KAW4_9GLOM|nr:247_t:CDS:2 [Racocetra persica]